MNPYKSIAVVGNHGGHLFSGSRDVFRIWPVGFAMSFLIYYGISVFTLPFAADVWLGEAPILAVVQLPKMYLNSAIQDVMISVLPSLNLASGSVSPDRMLTDSWALGATVVLPALTVLFALMLLRNIPRRRVLMRLVVVMAALDATVTCWFDRTSSLSLF